MGQPSPTARGRGRRGINLERKTHRGSKMKVRSHFGCERRVGKTIEVRLGTVPVFFGQCVNRLGAGGLCIPRDRRGKNYLHSMLKSSSV